MHIRTSFNSQKKDGHRTQSPVHAESTSDDSDSQGDAGHGKIISHLIFVLGSCLKLMNIIKLTDDNFKLMDFDAKVGLNASVLHHNFACLLDQETKRFYVWLGDVTIDKFNKSTFMNLATFAESNSSESMVLIQNRDHCQKSNLNFIHHSID